MAIIAVYNRCAGVGKTTTALGLLAAFAQRGARPLAVDLDPRAQLTRLFGAQPRSAAESMAGFFRRQAPLDDVAQITRSGVIVCPAHEELAVLDATMGRSVGAVTRLRGALRPGRDPSAPVIIDCGAALDVLALNALFACDLLLIPVSCDRPAARAAHEVGRAVDALTRVFKRRLPRRFVVTRLAESAAAGAGGLAVVAEELPDAETCRTRIREDARLAAAAPGDRERSRRDPDGAGTQDYLALLAELEPLLAAPKVGQA